MRTYGITIIAGNGFLFIYPKGFTMTSKEEILKELSRCVVEGDAENCKKLANEVLKLGMSSYEAIMLGCADGMNIVGQKYEKRELFVPEILLSAEAMDAAIDILKPHIKAEDSKIQATVLLGTVEGDIHDIGKNLVKILMGAAGFKIHDLGKDVPLIDFVQKSEEVGADVIALSSLVSTTMTGMKRVIEILKEKGIRDKVKVIVGGAVTTAGFAKQIGADGYGKDAVEAVKVTKELLSGKAR